MYDNPACVTLWPLAYIVLQLGKMGQKHEVKKKRGHNAAGGWYALGSAQCCRRLGSEKWHFNGKRVGFVKSD